jgi:hypothetical protein
VVATRAIFGPQEDDVLQLYRFIPAMIVLGVLPLNSNAADAPANNQTSSGTIIWDSKAAPATQGPSGTIIWNDAAPSQNTSQSAPQNIAPDKDGIIWDSPNKNPPRASTAPRTRSAAPPSTAADTAGPCREFQTHIVIDGKSEPAHGTACRQPDGTWRVVNR